MTIKLGDKVICKLTGFSGVVISKTEHLYGATDIGVEQEHLKDGMPTPTVWFTENRVELDTKSSSTLGFKISEDDK